MINLLENLVRREARSSLDVRCWSEFCMRVFVCSSWLRALHFWFPFDFNVGTYL